MKDLYWELKSLSKKHQKNRYLFSLFNPIKVIGLWIGSLFLITFSFTICIRVHTNLLFSNIFLIPSFILIVYNSFGQL